MQSDLGLKERREGVRSCGCTDEATCVSIRDEGAVEHVVAMVFFGFGELSVSRSLCSVCCVLGMKEACAYLSIHIKKNGEREKDKRCSLV